MKHEFWAEFDLYTASCKGKAQKVINDFVKHNTLNEPWNQITDHATFQHLLAQLLPTKDKNFARKRLLKWYQSVQDNFNQFLKDRLYDSQSVSVLEIFQWQLVEFSNENDKKTIAPSLPDISTFPSGSWAIQIHFTLRKPYISKDDVDFYIVDNPVKKEWVFKVPYVAPSQWKGALRAAMTRQLAEESKALEDWIERRLQLTRFFGNEKGVDLDDERFETYLDRQKPEAAKQYRQRLKEEYTQTGFLAGRLHFYPTFFDHIGLEVINPHPRDTGAGKQPIYFECVPAGTPGVFTLLYVPLDAGPKDTDTIKTDLHAVARGVRAMLTQYGFGAKTSSGYGVAKDDVVQGIMLLNFAEIPESLKAKSQTQPEYEPPEEVFLKYMDESGEVKPEFKGSGEGGLMSNSEYKQRGEALGGGSLKEFKRFRSWYVKHGTNWKASRETSPENSDTSAKQQITFQTLSEFEKIVEILISDGGKHA